MFCKHCGKEVQDGWGACPFCGYKLKEEAVTVSPIQAVAENDRIKRKSILKMILLGFITGGIYTLYVWYKFCEDMNKLCEGDGKRSPDFFVVLLLTICTLGIYSFYWWYQQAERLKAISEKYGISVKESGRTILCWQIFGNFLFYIGSFVATYIMFDNMNRLALIYNGEKTPEEINAMGPAHPKLVRNVIIIAASILIFIILIWVVFAFALMSDNSDIGDDGTDTLTESTEQYGVADFYVSLQDNESMPYQLSVNAEQFLRDHENFFPVTDYYDMDESTLELIEEYVNPRLEYRQIDKSPSKYGDEFMLLDELYVISISETELDGWSTFTEILASDMDDNVYVIWYNGATDILDEDTIGGIVLPLGETNYDNVSGGSTNALVVAGAIVETIGEE